MPAPSPSGPTARCTTPRSCETRSRNTRRPARAARFTPVFGLPDLAGDTVRLVRFAGHVTLVNFWASWCDPCRAEFPLMAELARGFDARDFQVVAISDDVDRGKMLAFVREFRPPFPILAGDGRMKATNQYRGLP